jgi:cytochrome P450
MLDRWQPIARRGEAMDVLSEMTGLTRAITLRVVFGHVDPADALAVGQALEFALGYADRQLWSALGWLHLPTSGDRRFRDALRTIDAFISGVIARARRGGPPPEAVLSVLMGAHDGTGERMRDAELHDEVKALLVAGHTTTASALAWVWYVLFQHPGVQTRLQRELRAVLDDVVHGYRVSAGSIVLLSPS